MRTKLAATLACCAAFGGPSSVGAMAVFTPAAAIAASARSQGCVYGKIGGVRKCLRAGEYCARRYQRQYQRYGFTCSKLDSRGDWHLERI